MDSVTPLMDGAGAMHSAGAAYKAPPSYLVTGVCYAAIILLVVMAVWSYIGILQGADQVRWVDHTYEVMLAANHLLIDQQDTVAGERGYLLTGKQVFIDQYLLGRSRVGPDIDTLARLTADNPEQQARIAQLGTLSQEHLARLDRLIKERRPEGPLLTSDGAVEVENSKRTIENLRTLDSAIIGEEQHLLTQRYADTERTQREVQLVIAAGNLFSLGALVICLLILNRQIGARREAEQQVRALNETLEARAALLELTNRELEGFSYSISHDLRSPLRAIDGFAQLLEEHHGSQLDAEGLRLLGVVQSNTQRMGALIEDLLAFSRLGRKSVESEPFGMQELVRECLREVLADASKVPEVTVGTLPDCSADRALIKQVWLNLIGNAVKYSGRTDHPRIEIEGCMEDGMARYTVRDNGIGFDMEYYDKLFGVFQRLHGPDEFPGTGVGLAIVQRVVVKHGGRVWAEAAVGNGAAFHFTLPLNEVPHE